MVLEGVVLVAFLEGMVVMVLLEGLAKVALEGLVALPKGLGALLKGLVTLRFGLGLGGVLPPLLGGRGVDALGLVLGLEGDLSHLLGAAV